MLPPRVPFRTLLPGLALVLVLLPAGCIMPARDAPAPAAVEETVVEEVAEPAPVPTITVTTDSNVRRGPGTEHTAHFWLATGAVATVHGRNADSTWLQIEHEGRQGWIHASLTNIMSDVLAGLPDTAPEALMADEPAEPPAAPTPEPAVVAEPTPEPEPEPAAPLRATAIVTGTVVNLRAGPGTEHPTDGQVRAGDQLVATGRNAAGDWLQVRHPVATGERVWIYAPLTDLDAAAVLTLAEVGTVGIEVAEPQEFEPTPAPEPEAIEPAPAPAAEPEPAPVAPAAAIPDCTQWHTVNPNETRLEQITNWFGLDLAMVEVINRLSNSETLVAGWQICLHTSNIDTTLPPAAEPVVAIEQPAATPAPESATSAPAPVVSGGEQPCANTLTGELEPCVPLPHFPDQAVSGPTDLPPNPPLWHPPGSYDKSEHPGFEHEFELVFSDFSTMWDWRVPDHQGCYDALRVHWGEIPKNFGLQHVEFRLVDPATAEKNPPELRAADKNHAPWTMPVLRGWPQIDPVENNLHPDLGVARWGCYLRPNSHAFCDIMPHWGNSHSIHLHAAVAKAMSNIVMYMSDDALGNRYNRVARKVLHANAYLFPLIDDRVGDPAGYGPCPQLWRVQ